MRPRRHVPYREDDNFGINASQTIMDLWNRLMGSIFAVTIGIVAVFMVVGGIVIMNIMLASVTERTHEIGIRKSLGARRRDILMQFVIESIVMSGAGGGIGVLLAFDGQRDRGPLSGPPRCRLRAVLVGLGSLRPRWAFSLASIPPARPPNSTRLKPCARRTEHGEPANTPEFAKICCSPSIRCGPTSFAPS